MAGFNRDGRDCDVGHTANLGHQSIDRRGLRHVDEARVSRRAVKLWRHNGNPSVTRANPSVIAH